MNKVIIKTMSIRNFKGIAKLDIAFDDKVNTIEAENGSGKTSIKNAWEWVIGQQVKQVYPELNEKEIPNLETSVEVTLNIDGSEYKFTRTSKPKYMNGVKVGNDMFYNIDGIDLNARQYQSKVADIIGNCPVDKFTMLTSKEFFNSTTSAWKWTDRRKILMEMTNAKDEAQKIIQEPKYEPIKDYVLKGYETSEIKSALTKDVNQIKKAQEGNLILIESKKKELDEYLSIDFQKVAQDLGLARRKLTELNNSEQNIENTKALDDRNSQISSLSAEISALKARDILKKKDMQEFKVKLYDEAIQTKSDYDIAVKDISVTKAELDKLQATQITDTCTLCGQKLPQDKVQQTKDNHDKLLAENTKKLNDLKDNARNLYYKYNNLTAQYADYDNKIKNFTENEHISELQKQISDLNLAIKTEKDKITSKSLSEEKTSLENTILNLEKEMTKKNYLEKGNTQIQKWQDENKDYAQRLLDIDKKLDVLQDFIKKQTDIIVATVNSYFHNGVSWQLYKTNYNGNLEECCECLYKGVAYTDGASDGERNRTDIEIIKALQDYYQVNIPIFVDRAETMTLDYNVDNQIIELFAKRGATIPNCTSIKQVYSNSDVSVNK